MERWIVAVMKSQEWNRAGIIMWKRNTQRAIPSLSQKKETVCSKKRKDYYKIRRNLTCTKKRGRKEFGKKKDRVYHHIKEFMCRRKK